MMVAHDLKEPVRNICSCARLLAEIQGGADHLDGVDEEQVRAWLLSSSDRLVKMVDAMASHARRGREEFEAQLDIGTIVDDVRVDLSDLMRRTGGRVECTSSMPVIEAGPLGMRLVFQNLIENGLKYARPDAPPRVRLSAERLHSGWLFRCRDNGRGMSPEHIPNAFEAFRRFDLESEGMGMGLCHVHQIIEAHDGAIWIESELGKGTVMAFTLPQFQLT